MNKDEGRTTSYTKQNRKRGHIAARKETLVGKKVTSRNAEILLSAH